VLASLGLAWLDLARHGLAGLGVAWLGWVWLAELSVAWLGWVWLAGLGVACWAGLGWAGLDWAANARGGSTHRTAPPFVPPCVALSRNFSRHAVDVHTLPVPSSCATVDAVHHTSAGSERNDRCEEVRSAAYVTAS
jgi:hypothetical protein